MSDEPIKLSLSEVAALVVKDRGIHEGIWGLSVRFGIGATNLLDPEQAGLMHPAAVVPILHLGLQRFQEPNSMTVDAAKVNPKRNRVTKTK